MKNAEPFHPSSEESQRRSGAAETSFDPRLLSERFEQLGFSVVRDALSPDRVAELRCEADRLLALSERRGGARNALHRSDRLRTEGLRGASYRIASAILGPGARPTKLTLFDKTPTANWLVQWHQDLAIAVRERVDAPGFSGWSRKEGVLHVRPPASVLEGIVAVRLHLDDTPASNGALRVLPGSHGAGILTRDQIEQHRGSESECVCEVQSGAAMVMSPLLLHASSKSTSPKRRRVLHFEYSASDLPAGLRWA